ncbi:hypothetical protein ABFX02_01G062600 [Erythranthe guttata]
MLSLRPLAIASSTRNIYSCQKSSSLSPKEKGLVRVLQMADDLRLKTLKELILILTPIQGAYFLIAAAELHLKIHHWGKNRDTSRNHHHHHHYC